MKRFQINLTCGSAQQSQCVTRYIQSLVVSNLLFLEFTNIRNRLFMITSINFKNYTVNKIELIQALNELKELREISCESMKLSDESCNLSSSPADLNHLETLKMKFSDDRILLTINTTSLKNFSIHNLESQKSPENVIKFLMEQRDLETLKIVGTLGREFLLNDKTSKLNFQLQSLKISKSDLSDCSDHLIVFLGDSSCTLENLVIDKPTRLVVDEFIVTNLVRLKSLQINAHLMKEDERFYKSVDPNYHIRHLKLLGKIVNHRPFSKIKFFFDTLRDLESFDISKLSGLEDQKMVKILPILYTGHNPRDKPSMREIRCFSITEIAKNRPTYENLKGLYVTRIDDEELFNNFISRNIETLETISIKEINDAAFTRGLTVSAISDCIRLKKLIIGCNSTAVIKMFDKIMWNHSWTFEINLKKEDKKIIFKFPDDKPVFKETVRIWDDNLIRTFTSSSNFGMNIFINKFK